MRHWTATRLGRIVLLGLTGLVLQQVAIAYRIDFAGKVQDASLVHLHAGLLLAIALLARDRWTMPGVGLMLALGWCVRQTCGGEGGWPVLAWGLAAWCVIVLWTRLCAHWAGWPVPGHGRRFVRTRLPRLAAVTLLLYPLGMALVVATSIVLDPPRREWLGEIFQTFFATQFGVAVVTLPLMLAWTERDHRQWGRMPSRALRVGWPLLLGGALGLGVLASRWLYRGFADAGVMPPVLMDFRFVMFVVLAFLVIRLSPLGAMLALSSGLFLLVAAAAGAAPYGNTVLGFFNLLHIAVEVSILLISMLYVWLGRRDRRILAHDLSEQALRNSITLLPNLRALTRDLQRRPGGGCELAYLLLDQVDFMVTGFGLDTQTAVMQQTAAQLRRHARVYYVGTGQFVLIREPQALSWEQLMHTLEAAELDLGGQRLRLSPYMGVAPLYGEGASGLDAALRASSHLAFDARRRSDVLPRYAAAADLQQQDLQLRQLQDAGQALDSLRRHRIALHFQPIVPLRDGGHAADKLCGEVLCRLFDQDGTLISPARFMAPIEAAGRGVELDLAVIRTLRGELERHRAALPHCGRISINLTGQSVASPSFRSELRSLLARWPLPLSTLCFEITETAAIASTAAAIELLEELRAGGCRIAIDDFGTGMQSFTRLKELPLDEIKIDGSFIRNVVQRGRDHALVQASVAVAQAFGAETVAEFVEDAETAQCLRAMGVDWAQGHFYGRPRPLADVLLDLAVPELTPSLA